MFRLPTPQWNKFRRIRILCFAIGFAMVTTLADVCSAQPALEKEELYDLSIANAEAIRNFDVIIKTWRNSSAVNDHERKLHPDIEQTRVFRVVFDSVTSQCMVTTFANENGHDNVTKYTQRSPNRWKRYRFANGFYTIQSIGNASESEKIPGNPSQLLAGDGLPSIRVCGLTAIGFPLSGSDIETLRSVILHDDDSDVRVRPDGAIVLNIMTESPELDRKRRVEVRFDPKSLMPVRYSAFTSSSGTPESRFYNHVVRYEASGGVYRVCSLQYDKSEFGSPFSDGKPVKVDHIGTLEFNWKGFNEPNFTFPANDGATPTAKDWGKYLDLTTSDTVDTSEGRASK